MPCLRGIEVSLSTNPGDEQIPEYPHPEGTSARILGVSDDDQVALFGSSVRSCTESPVARRKAGPIVSVYIPSIPGTAFAINYAVNTAPPAPCKYVFFRLYINSRPIAAWGIDPDVQSSGSVVKSLWAPCARYDGHVGFEARNFVFLPGQERKSVAEDGGLIEVQAFRARERRARAPRVEEFRLQESYGIAAPSIGLVEQPQDACFYDWHLIDAKDEPFASFRIHYRSWENLNQLNLIPATELELLHEASPKALKSMVKIDIDNGSDGLHETSFEGQSFLLEDSDDASIQELTPKPNEIQVGKVLENSDDASIQELTPQPHEIQFGKVLEDSDDDSIQELRLPTHEIDVGKHQVFHTFISPPEFLVPAGSYNPVIPQPSKTLRDGAHVLYPQRPLPRYPIEGTIGAWRRASATSVVSATHTIASSLLQHIDEGSVDNEEVEIGVAHLVNLPQSKFALDTTPVKETKSACLGDYSFSDYENSPRSTNGSPSAKKMPSPSSYLPTTGSGLERGLALFATPQRPSPANAVASTRSLLANFHSEFDLSRMEMMVRPKPVSPCRSPTRRRAAKIAARLGRTSPQKNKSGGRSFLSGLQKLSGLPRKSAAKVSKRELPEPPAKVGDLAQSKTPKGI
ncbi:hypothetical protein N656DRAFT_799761 [Canariomyces notabilis]|uniref:Uncharacterized protein n=1 Tax=Canariomyces notabilis TaxID=2074819 RepID=A0AAN6QI12_9PEZI|nr:hypothetical protein N656DRAFT_799761 [Canariomyces arenarius]